MLTGRAGGTEDEGGFAPSDSIREEARRTRVGELEGNGLVRPSRLNRLDPRRIIRPVQGLDLLREWQSDVQHTLLAKG